MFFWGRCAPGKNFWVLVFILWSKFLLPGYAVVMQWFLWDSKIVFYPSNSQPLLNPFLVAEIAADYNAQQEGFLNIRKTSYSNSGLNFFLNNTCHHKDMFPYICNLRKKKIKLLALFITAWKVHHHHAFSTSPFEVGFETKLTSTIVL